jgi:hypothetical protein
MPEESFAKLGLEPSVRSRSDTGYPGGLAPLDRPGPRFAGAAMGGFGSLGIRLKAFVSTARWMFLPATGADREIG